MPYKQTKTTTVTGSNSLPSIQLGGNALFLIVLYILPFYSTIFVQYLLLNILAYRQFSFIFIFSTLLKSPI